MVSQVLTIFIPSLGKYYCKEKMICILCRWFALRSIGLNAQQKSNNLLYSR